MTVIRPNSVSGINSITAQANEIKIFKSDGTQGGLVIGGANLNATSGISTVAALTVTGNVSVGGTLTYQDVTNIDSVGVITARAGVHVTGGNVAVGHNNPSVNLHVKGSASNGQIYLGGTGAHSQIYADNDGVLILNADQGNSAANSYLGFNVDNSEKLRINSAGKIGINQASPFAELDITSTTETTTGTLSQHGIRLSAPGAADGEVIPITGGFLSTQERARAGIGFISRVAGSSVGYAGAIGFYTRSSADGSGLLRTDEKVRINESGTLIVDAGGDAQDIQIISHSGGGGHGRVYLRGNASNESSSIQLNHYGHADYYVSAGRAGNGLFSITRTNGGSDGIIMDSSGNMGLGVTPIAPGYTTLHIGESSANQPVRLQMSTANTGATASDGFTLSIDGSSSAVNLIQREGAPIQFYTNNSERMRVFGTGACLQINTTSTPTTGGFQLPQISIKQVASNWTGGIHIESSGSTKLGCIASTEDGLEISQSYRSGTSYGPILFRTSGIVRSKLLSNGYFQMGSGYLGSTAYHRFNGINNTQGQTFFVLSGYQGSGGSSGDTAIFNSCNSGASVNSTSSAMLVFRNSSTTRSINASGTINASGADYAEYMTKAGNFTLAKGDVCGVNSEGKLTNVFADAISFVVKSTDPSYVGGDKWHEVAGEQPGGYDDTRTEEEIAAAKVVYEEALESARQLVDRIAFSGQVPVNVTGATPGQHIIPTAASDGSIEGTAKAEADLTMAEYMSSVGKVIAIEDDGRARIIVKVA